MKMLDKERPHRPRDLPDGPPPIYQEACSTRVTLPTGPTVHHTAPTRPGRTTPDGVEREAHRGTRVASGILSCFGFAERWDTRCETGLVDGACMQLWTLARPPLGLQSASGERPASPRCYLWPASVHSQPGKRDPFFKFWQLGGVCHTLPLIVGS